MRLNVPASFEALRISRAGSPSRSVIHPLSPVEGPSRMPETLAVGLRAHFQRFVPLVPFSHKRYEREVRMSEDDSKEIELEPLRMDYSDPDPPGWTSYLHPEGVRYFCDIEKRIYTDANLYDSGVQSLVNQSIDEIYDFMRINSIILSPSADLVLDFVEDKVYYYFAEHKNRSVFYFDKMNTADFRSWQEVQGASSLTHFGHLIEAEYWWHIFLFPSSLKISEEIVNELRDTVIHGIGDCMTTPFSTITYSNEDLYKLLSVTNSLKENIGTSYGGSICMLSRFMWGFAHGRFLHWHGQPAVRLSRDMSAHGPVVKVRSWIMKISSALLFSAPDIHLRNLEKIWVDHLMYEHIWKQSTQKLINEWQEFTLFSTVLLNANVAFLAIQTIDQDNHPYRSPGQVSSYLSMISSIGSIILSLLLVRLNRTKEKDNARDAWAFLSSREHPKYGLEILAIVYSLPYALLMWGVVGFLAAIAWMCMADADASTRVLTGFAWLAIAILILLCVWMGWESESGDEPPQGDSGSGTFSVWREKMLLCFDSRRSSTDSSSRPQWHRLSFLHRRKSKDSEDTVV
ncbi:hypothetical protein BDQ17DRAFT_827858 [Cyathus striatus]|nr:hypothetical protein BDQ17DRAFT_827858 [Cyathus striatus]